MAWNEWPDTASSSTVAEAEGPTALLDLQRHLTQRIKRRCGFSDSRRRIQSSTWPFISHDATLSSTCNHRKKAESRFQPASTWEVKVWSKTYCICATWHDTIQTLHAQETVVCVFVDPRLNKVFQKFHQQEWFTVGLLAEPDSKLILPSSFIYPR